LDITVIIPYYNGQKYIAKLLSTIPANFPVVVVDDLSDSILQLDGESLSNCRVDRLDKKGYFAGAVNHGIQSCSTDVVVINQDVWFEGFDWVEFINKQKDSYDFIGESITGAHPAWSKSYIHGTFMYMSRKAINKVGLLDTKYFPHWGNTCEWQLRACRQGFKVLPVKEIPGMHHERKGNFGEGTKMLLDREPDKKAWLIRTPPLVSIVVPCYNYGKYLPDLVASLIGGKSVLGVVKPQTLQAFELIIVDDCSTDNTAEIAKSFVDPWKAIHYYRTPANLGSAGAMNFGIVKSNSPYITRIDADDMRSPNSIEILYDAAVENSHSFVYDDMHIFSKGIKREKPWKMEEYDFEKTLTKNQIPCGIMYSYKAWTESGGYPELMNKGREDWAFNIALGVKGYCGVHVNNAGYLYRRDGQNRTLKNTTPEWRAKFVTDLKTIFPAIFEGVRPMGCCGGGARNVKIYAGRGSAKAQPRGGNPAMLAGATGTITVKYVGGNYGTQIFYGPFTGTAYVFSAKKTVGNIDKRDAHFDHEATRQHIGILDLVRTPGKSLFVIYEKPITVPVIVSVPAPVRSSVVVPTPTSAPVVEVKAVIEAEPKVIRIEVPTATFEIILEKVVGKKVAFAIINYGYTSAEEISSASDKELLDITGVGKTTLKKLRSYFDGA
jgi:glycosyltransferase involved in cell wall biosynthesis